MSSVVTPRSGILAGALLVLLLAGGAGAQDAGGHTPLLDAEGFLRASSGRPVVLPADHGSHPDTRTEWWYLTGPLEGPDGERFGFQATWFRRALVREQPAGRSPLAVRDVLLFHGVLTEVATGRLHFTEQASRAYDPWAWAATDRLDVGVFANVLQDEAGDGRRARLVMGDAHADDGPWTLELELDLTATAPLLHGSEPGLSIKGREEGQASWYYTLPAIAVTGRLLRDDRPPMPLTGRAWMDHEFGSSQLEAGQEGWDWFSVVLDDGSELMLYQMRRPGGVADVTSSGTLRTADGRRRHLVRDDFSIEPEGRWTSPRTGFEYPSGWALRVPGEDLELRVTPALPDQELETPGTTGVTYWEGLCGFEGTRAGAPVRGEGYVELVGYGDPIADRFLAAGSGDADEAP